MTGDWDALGQEAALLLSRLIQIPSVTGTGFETAAARLLAAEARACGLSAVVHEPEPGAGSLVVQLPGEIAESLLLLSHLDVAPPGDETAWRCPPFSGAMVDGEVWGRGAVDAKGLAVAWLTVMRLLQTESRRRRGVVMVATAGEEGGGHNGLRWLLAQGILRHCRWALGEGGGTPLAVGRGRIILVQTAEKGRAVLRLPKGFVPPSQAGWLPVRPGAAYGELVSAMAQARGFPAWAGRLLPQSLLWGRAPHRIDLREQRAHTWQITEDRLLCRVCPGSTVSEVAFGVARALGLHHTPAALLEETEPTASPVGGPLWEAIAAAVPGEGLGTAAAPFCTPGFSDNRLTRAAGIPTYGFFPVPAEELVRQHQPDERVRVSSLTQATRLLWSVVRRFCTG